MKYRCLILDHDDTLVKSTPTVHYPSFVRIMKAMKPHLAIPDIREFMEYCSEPGYFRYCNEILGFTPEENVVQDEMWFEDVEGNIPAVYEGFPELLHDFVAAGGVFAVVTHSQSDIVRRDYEAHSLPMPQLIFGAELPDECRKPNPWPIEQVCEKLKVAPADILLVDDLMTGLLMAKNCSVPSAAAGWSHISDKVAARVRECCDYYCESVEDLRKLIF